MLNTIEYNSAEAVTMDGVNWDIYVRNSALVKDLEQYQHNHHRIQTSEIRYGRWSKKNGLQRGPTINSEDFIEMTATGDIVYQYLIQHSDDIPFPFRDNYELWLLDQWNNPLALLNSTVYKEDIDVEQYINWTAGIACKETFKPNANNDNNINHASNAGENLNQLINSYSNQSAQWILRKDDGSGLGLEGINLKSGLINRNIPVKNIPSQLINNTLFTQSEQNFINEYYLWLSPWLLVLHTFTNTQREVLEQQACSNALTVEKQHILYPKIINQKLIKSALVEAILRKNTTEIVTEKVESVEYLELNNPTHHLNK